MLLNEQIALEVFNAMPDVELLIVICDEKGNYWASDQCRFSKVISDRQELERICTTIMDGCDPVIHDLDDCTIVATQLDTERTNCGCLFLVLPAYTRQSTLANMEVIELLLSQLNLVARLIDKNNHFHQMQLKYLSDSASNCRQNLA
jgi:hypothetical protein